MAAPPPENGDSGIGRLLAIMARLRDPARGCPWDREQSFATIAPHTLEEAYEVVDAIERGDREALKDELGDLLFQVVYYAEMAKEEGRFGFADVVAAIANKMVRRHPHVFGPTTIGSAAAQRAAWEAHKAAERGAAATAAPASALAGVVAALPAITRAHKLQARAARVGFDWEAAPEVLDKIAEEIGELRTELASGRGPARLADEVGDLLFACVNLARKLAVEPEGALRRANAKFERRFRWIEARLAERGLAPDRVPLAELERLWQQAKGEEGSDREDPPRREAGP